MFAEIKGFDPVKDRTPVDPYGFVNLAEAYVNGCVPTVVEDVVANYNGIDDPESIVGVPSDIFEGYRMRDAIIKQGEKVSEKSTLSEGVVTAKATE